MFGRRFIMGFAVCAALALASTPGLAQEWKSSYPELVFAVIPAENASGVVERYTPLAEYLSKQLGVTVKLKTVTSYAEVIEGQRSGQIHIAYFTPASYARAYMTGVKTEPFAVEVTADGGKTYHSVFYVKRNSPYRNIVDLEGKNLGLVDPDSTSGNVVPRFALHKMNIDPETFFGKIVYSGSHENAIFALKDGTVDVCANWWNHEGESNLRRMERKGIPGIKYMDYRIIYVSDPIVNSPIAYLSELPDDLKKAIREAIFDIELNDKAAFDSFSKGKYLPWEPVSHKEYEPVIELVKSVDNLRKKATRTPPVTGALPKF
ncbi:MAG: phosphonate ABC transporter substrate-binding protein [Rhodomicrobium sp.]